MANYVEPGLWCVEHNNIFMRCFRQHTRPGHPKVVEFIEQQLPAVRPLADGMSRAFGGHSDAWLLHLPDMPVNARKQLVDVLREYETDSIRIAFDGMTNWIGSQP